MKEKISISLCLPAFNEEANIEKAIRDATAVLNDISDNWEIVVVDDGSLDYTAGKVKALMALDKRIRLMQHAKNKGYGAALITGFYSASKEWAWLSAADNQFDPKQIYKFLPFISSHEIIIGYRAKRADPLYRRLYARAYNGLIMFLLGLRIKDINCGFKLVKRKVFDRIKLTSSGALIDAEFFAKCKQNKFTLKEVAVEHKPREFGEQTGGNIAVILKMFTEVLRLKIRENL